MLFLLIKISLGKFLFKKQFVVKDEKDRLAVLSAAISGNPKFFLGTDSAPHALSKKESNACLCPGVFSAYNALELYVEIFDKEDQLDKFEAFASFFGVSVIEAPFFSNFFISLLSKSKTVSLKLFLSKLPANFPPTLPNPINPIFICVLIVKLIFI